MIVEQFYFEDLDERQCSLQQFKSSLLLRMQQILSSQVCLLDPQREIYRMGNIGAGKFGTVYQGYDKVNSRMVALKYVCNNKEETWKKQIKVLQNFDHPNIIKYYCYIPEIVQNSDVVAGVYIVTEFVRGKTLDEYVASASKVNEKGLSEDLVFKLFSQLLDGYGYVHDKNFVHRDIKPQNILVDENQNIKIIDFGQSKQRKLLKTKGLAPETFCDKVPADFRRDVWSLGLVLYEMITGRCYFEEWKQCSDQLQFYKHLENHRIKIKYPQNFNPFWTDITKKMLKKDYTKRINLHEIIFQMKKQEPSFQKKRHPLKAPLMIKNLSSSVASGSTNPLTQSQNQFQLSRTKRYLKFFYNKYRFLILLSQFFRKYSYPFLSNAHKLILVFVSLNIYVAAIDHLLKRLQKNRIKITDNQIYEISQFEQPYKSVLKQHLQVYQEYYEKQSRITKDVILQKIIPKFSPSQQKSSGSESNSIGTSSSNLKQLQAYDLIQKYPQIKEMMENFREGINLTKQHYIEKFKELVFSEDFYHGEENIRRYFYQEDMLVYYLMLIICNIDDLLRWNCQYFGNEIPKLREELENNNRDEYEVQQLIDKIKKFNHKK